MMKISREEGAVILLAVVFLAFSAGWMVRTVGTSQSVRIETERTGEELPVEIPSPTPLPAGERVDLNTAGVEELQALPGIGEKRAADIVADREANGPFRYPEDLTRVKGIGEETVRALLDHVTVKGETP